MVLRDLKDADLKMKIVSTIEARMSSTRLPGKVLLPILGKPMLELLIERLRRTKCVDEIVVATTTKSTDDIVEDLAYMLGVGCFRGSEEDVLNRVLQAARSANGDVIVEITGDCPLIDPNVVDEVIAVYLAGGFDYVATSQQTFPLGLDTQVFPVAVLEEVANLTQDPVDREHVSHYIYQHPDRFAVYRLASGLPKKYWNLRLTVDTQEDFKLIRAIFEELYTKNPAFNLLDVLDLLDRKPELIEINQHIQQKQMR